MSIISAIRDGMFKGGKSKGRPAERVDRKTGRVIELQGRVSLKRVVLVYSMKDSVRLSPIGLMIKKGGGSFFVVHHFFGDEGVNVVKVAWFSNRVVMAAIWQCPPNLALRGANREKLGHIGRTKRR